MQGLLARLKTVRDQNVDSDVPQREEIGGIKNHFTLNKFINHTESNEVDNKNLPNGTIVDKIDYLDTELDTCRTDDAVEIEIVMASNKVPGKFRQRSTGSSPRQIVKNSKTRGSRVSLNSVALSEKDDLDTLNLDSDDEVLTAGKSGRYSPQQAWAAFENCVKSIDNSNPEYFVKKPKPNFVSSGTFQQVMVDMYGNTEYGNTKGYTILKQKLNNMARSTMLASRMMQTAVEKGQEEREKEEEILDNESVGEQVQESSKEPESVKKVFAKRGWKILKREVNETTMEQKIQSTKLNWTMLQHTLKQMSNVERTRQDLYERYGIVPVTLPDGTTVCENRMLSERARAQLYGRNKDGSEYKRPKSYQPPSLHLRSRSQSGYQHAVRDGAKSAKLPNLGRGRQRPVTAKP